MTQKFNQTLYISSLGFDYSNNSIQCYMLSTPLENLSRTTKADSGSEYCKTEAQNIDLLFKEADNSVLMPMNFKHTKSLVLTEAFLTSDHFKELLLYIKSSQDLTFNFYVFVTTDSLEDIYSFSNPASISFQFSILSSPDLVNYEYFGSHSLHFLDLSNNYFNGKRFIHIPFLKCVKYWKDKTSLLLDGFVSFSNGKAYEYKKSEYKAFDFLYSQKILMYEIDRKVYKIRDYTVKFEVKDEVFTVIIDYDLEYGQKEELNDFILTEIATYFDSYIQNSGSLYLIDIYNYINKRRIVSLRYDIIFK